MHCRVPVLLSATFAILTAVAAGRQADAQSYRIVIMGGVDASAFPEVSLRFRILNAAGEPATVLPAEDIVLYEDGQEVARVTPQRLREAPAAVVLALDTSGSMERQNKLTEARQAALAFFERLDPRTPCGLVLFHHAVYQRIEPKDRKSVV